MDPGLLAGVLAHSPRAACLRVPPQPHLRFMKPTRLIGALALAAAFAAPAGLAAQDSPPPENWWQLDATADRFPGTSAVRAYRDLLAGKQPKRTVTVAIIDSGVDSAHVDLDGVLWVNEDEVAGNGRDDDNNGYVDDVHGWNFIGGRDGRNVGPDTYEVTRLYAYYRAHCEGPGRDSAPANVKAECTTKYPEIRREFEENRSNAVQMLQQMKQIDEAVQGFVALLKAELGAGELTEERVRALNPMRADVRQARDAFLQLAAAGVTPEQISEQRKSLEEHVRFGYNPSFDSRTIVGDNPNDLRERGYGNTDVTGPDATHGTHVAGIVGAERGNGQGVDGIAPAVRLMILRTVPNGDERDKDVANAIRYAVDNGANVINMSFGKGYSPQKEVVDEAVRYADSRGVLLVHAAGNDGADITAKGNFPTRDYLGGGQAKNWIEVGASAWWGADSLAAPFSNYGREKVDVFAPGVSIYSTVPGNEYERNDGTSMASPVVAGLAALIMAYYPELSAEQVKAVILESATKYPGQVTVPGGGSRVAFGQLSATGGVVNAYAALQLAEQRAAAARR